MRNFYQIFKIMTISLLLMTHILASNWTHTTVGSASVSTRPVICSDPLGNLHVAWSSGDYVGEFIQYANNLSGTWSFQKQVAGRSGNQAYSASITADREGYPYVIFRYFSSNYEPYYVTDRNVTSSSWSVFRPMLGAHYHECLIEVDSEFKTHSFAQEDSWGSNIYYQKLDTENNIVLPNVTQFYSTSIDQNDNIQIMGYNDGTGLYYKYFDGTSWSDPDTIDQVNTSVFYYHPSITCDINNVTHIVSSSTNGIYYINNLAGNWSTPELVTDGGIFPNVVADENSKAHVSFYTQEDGGGLFYTNNFNGSWLTPEYIAPTSSGSVSHVESKIALDPNSNSVNIVYISSSNLVKVAQTNDYNLRNTKNTDLTSTLTTLAQTAPKLDTLSTSTSGPIEMLKFSIKDLGGDGLPIKINKILIQYGSGMSNDLTFNDLFSEVTLGGSDGSSVAGTIYASKIHFGSLDNVWKEISENSSCDFTVSATLKQNLQNVDSKSVQMKINGLYDIIIDPSGSRFDYNCANVVSDTMLMKVLPDHFIFLNLGSDFFGENLVEGWMMQLKIVDANGIVATSVTGIDVTLSAVQLDGVTPTTAVLQSSDGLTKTFSNGIAQFSNIVYPDSGQFRILATCDALVSASDTLSILPFYQTLLIAQPENMSELLKNLGIEHDLYSAYNYKYPTLSNLLRYKTIIIDDPYSVSSYFDTTNIKTFLESGTAENPKSILAFGDNALGYYSNSEFADHYFGGKIQDYCSHDNTTLNGVSGDPVTDGLTLSIESGYTSTITPNSSQNNSSTILTFSQTGNIVGVKTYTNNYKTVLLSSNQSYLTANAQKDTLINRIYQWFQKSEMPQTYPPVITDIPDINMTEDVIYTMPVSDWYPYVDDADTPDKNLLWNIVNGSYCTTSIENDTLILHADANFYGKDTILVTVSDGEFSDSGTVLLDIAPVNDPPNNFILLTPENEFSTMYNSDSSEIFFSWNPAIDIDSDSIIYIFKLYTDLYGSNTRIVKDTSIIIDYTQETLIHTFIPIYWTVTAFDLQDSTIASNSPFTFGLSDIESVDNSYNLIPDKYILYANYPNPFNPTTTIKYGLPEDSHVTITIFDINGRQVQILAQDTQNAGYHSVQWDASKFGSGVYFYQIIADNFQQVRKCILIK